MYDLYEIPYEHFKQMPNAETFLKPGVTFAELDRIATAMSDLKCATLMQKAKLELFKTFRP